MSLILKDFGVSYSNTALMKDINVDALPAGQIIALVGANGAGKSSILRALAGLGQMHGQALLDAHDLGRMPMLSRARQVAYMPQSLPQASSLNVYESVLSALRTACPQLSAATSHARIAQVFSELDLETLAMQPLDQLSGGQRQMIGLAQLLAREPRLLLLDEPTSALDLRWQLCLLEALRTHARQHQTICLMAIHDLNLAIRFCDNMLVLADRRLIARGAPGQILTPALLAQAYGIDARIETCSLGSAMVIAERAINQSR